MTSPNNKPNNKDIDQHSGIETTGHEWDGIKELNNPAPRWWLWVFFITCIWAFGYWVIYPAWPTFSEEHARGGTKGSLEWTQYKQLSEAQQEITARKTAYLEKFRKSSFDAILNNPELYNFAIAGGKAAFKNHCATCHGTGGEGSKGYPNLNDDDWLWGGTVDAIYHTINVGARSTHDESRTSSMPAFDTMLTPQEIQTIAQYVFSMSTQQPSDQSTKGAHLYQEHCAACHGSDGKGNTELGAPNLADHIWLYSKGDIADIMAQIQAPKHGTMPAWNTRLDNDTIRQLAIYVHELGGGQ